MSDIQALKDRLTEQESQAFKDIESRRRRLNTELETAEKRMKAHDAAMGDYIKVTRRAADVMTKKVVPALDAFQQRAEKMPFDAEFEVSAPTTPEGMARIVDKPFSVKTKLERAWSRRTSGTET